MFDDEHWLKRWVVAMTAEELSDRTVNERIRAIHQFSEETGHVAGTVDPYTIATWLTTKNTPATRQSYYCHLAAWFRFLVRMEARVDNPMDKLKSPKRHPGVPRPLRLSDINRVLEWKYLRSYTRDRILLGALAGLRVHEIAKIHGKDIDLENGTLYVIGKGRKSAVLPLHTDLLTIAQRYPRNDYWFPSTDPDRLHVAPRTISTGISNAFEQVNIQATAHQLRHFYATYLVEQGVNLRIVQSLLRHESLNTTALYTKVSPKMQQKAIAELPTFLGSQP